MMRCLVAVLLLPSLASAAELGGTWEIQSMGGDRKVDVQQRGNKLIAHRVMWPTFEGQKYKLEHLFRGTISGKNISGELLVKEEGFKEYEILRAFDGSIRSNDRMTLDGNPLKRTGGGSASAPAAEPQAAAPPEPSAPAAPPRPPEGPSASPAAPPPPPKPEPAKDPKPSGSPPPGAGLFNAIMSSPGMESLFEDALKVEIPQEVARLTAEGDALFGKRDYRAALAKFDEASAAGGGADPQLLHRTGRCQLKLKLWSAAKKSLRKAAKLDPDNKQIRRDYKKAKRKAR